MIATLGLTVIFRRSDNLAAAYGIAVSLTMLLTSVLLFIAMREIWGWSPVKAGAAALVLLIVDFGFFTGNVTKVLEGGYVPLLLAAAVYGVMWIWQARVRSARESWQTKCHLGHLLKRLSRVTLRAFRVLPSF
jgi:KUP system potassium uptake protein